MPIFQGNNQILFNPYGGNIWLGDIPVKEIWLGTELVWPGSSQSGDWNSEGFGQWNSSAGTWNEGTGSASPLSDILTGLLNPVEEVDID
jgi:hypothetical protein